MPTGLQVPLVASKSGGAKIQDESLQLDKLVVLSLLEGGDDNPFQNIGLSPSVLYNDNSDEAKSEAKTEITEKLQSFKERLTLSDEGVVISEEQNPEQENEYTSYVRFDYVNLDVNDAREFASSFEKLGDV